VVTSTSSSRGYRLKPSLATSASDRTESVITSAHINAVGKAMRVTVQLLPGKKKAKVLELKKGARAEDAIRAIGLYPDAWIPVRGDDPIPVDEPLKEGERLKLIAVVSGG
jgi:sulfur carrier protein ThiS